MADMIPATVGAILIPVVAMLPGVPAEVAFSRIVGKSWLELEIQRYIRIVGFSVAGLAGYGAMFGVLGLRAPSHIVPATFSPALFSVDKIAGISLGYLGHVTTATIIALLLALAIRLVRKLMPSLVIHQDSWDKFVRTYADGRWVVITTSSGESYAGIIQNADFSRDPMFRDIVLYEPAVYDEIGCNYIATSYQFLFLKGCEIVSLGAIFDNCKDKRITEIGLPIFSKGDVQ